MKPADLIFHGGQVRTMDPGLPVTDAVAVRAGRIVAVGEDDVRSLRGSGTNVVNMRGATLLPGFQDAHAHPVVGGLNQMSCDLSELHSLPEYLSAIRGYAAENPELDWITGAGWYGDVFPGGFPTREQLDRVVPDRPALFTSHDWHGAWANTIALERAGISRTSADPTGGWLMRDEDGVPTGMLFEGAADLVADLLPTPSEDDLEQAILHAQSYLHSLGITAWQDAAVGEALGIPDPFNAYCSLAGRELLTAHVVGALWWQRAEGIEQLDGLRTRRDSAGNGHFRATAVKIMQDGVCENLTAAMLEPYRGHPHEHGMSFLEPDDLCKAVAALDAAEFDVHCHAVGDRAVRECLDAVDAATHRSPDHRHQLAHIDLIDPAEVSRMKDLRVIANVQPLWARRDQVLVDTKLPYLNEIQQQRHFAFGTLAHSGVALAMGSDWPVSSPNPLWGVHCAVNRTAPPGDPHARDKRAQSDPLLPDEAITASEAVTAYTAGSTRANRLESDTGSITEGKAADLVLLDADPLVAGPRCIGSISVVLTVAGGSIAYCSNNSS